MRHHAMISIGIRNAMMCQGSKRYTWYTPHTCQRGLAMSMSYLFLDFRPIPDNVLVVKYALQH
jgi:hypothetical protein